MKDAGADGNVGSRIGGQPLLRRNSRRVCGAAPPWTAESPSRWDSPWRCCAFFFSSASLNLRFISSEEEVAPSSVLMSASLGHRRLVREVSPAAARDQIDEQTETDRHR